MRADRGKIVTAILEPPVIEKILTRLGFQVRAPRCVKHFSDSDA